MPSSDHLNIAPILTVILSLKPTSILDVGCGFGKFGVLLREYLEVWNGRLKPAEWKSRIEGVDAYPQYRNPLWDFAYNKVHIGPAQEVLPTLGSYDVILIADMIEHLELEAARELASQCLDKCSTLVISTPKEFYPQEAENENSFERHLCLFSKSDLPDGISVETIPALSCNIFVASKQPFRARFFPTTAVDLAFLQSRHKLKVFGVWGWPVSKSLQLIGRLLT